MKDLIVGTFEIPTTTQIGTYLRTPILTTRRTTNAYQYIVDKIQKKIEGWQDKYLSVVNRVTLIKSSTASIPLCPTFGKLYMKEYNGYSEGWDEF